MLHWDASKATHVCRSVSSGDPDKPTAEQPAAVLPRLHPPLRPFKPGQRGHLAWLDAVLEINGITDEPTKHAVLLSTLPADLQYLSAASLASPRPYNALRAAVLAYNGEPYWPPYSESFASAAAKCAVVPGPRSTHASDPPPKPVTTYGTSWRPSSSSLSEPTLDVEVDHVESSITSSTEWSSPSETSPPALSQVPASLERNLTSTVGDLSDSSDTANTTPADRTLAMSSAAYTIAVPHPVPATSTSMPSNLDNDPSTTVIPWQQQSISASMSSVVQEPAHHELPPPFRDVATKAETPDNNAPPAPLLEPPRHDDLTPPAEPHAIFHMSLAPSIPGGSGITSAPPDLPAVSTSSPVTQTQAARDLSGTHSAPTINSAHHDREPITNRRTGPSLVISPAPVSPVRFMQLPPQCSRVRRYAYLCRHPRCCVALLSASLHRRHTCLSPPHGTILAEPRGRPSRYTPTLCIQYNTRVCGDYLLPPKHLSVHRAPRPLRNSQCRPPELS
ncbi:hypothetical protein HPB50_022145 [Hyalomma asiaticum]|uniref:Uncharacterized protein n=1 Tax=Hyalomma asiaticum TaxID=266040 RepID=A0ACB7T966_HYAAI|nr:hypothetical protein HPB50_022145 [Hyalomma asiaticum]